MSSLEYFDSVAENRDQLLKNMFTENTRLKALNIAQVHAGDLATDIGATSGVKQSGRPVRRPGTKFLKVTGQPNGTEPSLNKISIESPQKAQRR